ncbi:TPA: hypothetical protein R1765_001964 [Campylobacter coli]|nr:hypothetical protein [Campylobacter coli]
MKIYKFLLLVLSFVFIGCGTTRTIYITEYKDKYIPIKCEVVMPKKPIYYKNNVYKTLDEVLAYSERLKIIVDKCAKVDYNNTKIIDNNLTGE